MPFSLASVLMGLHLPGGDSDYLMDPSLNPEAVSHSYKEDRMGCGELINKHLSLDQLF